MTSRQNAALLAARLGHTRVGVEQSARGLWFSSCACGWVSTQTALLVNAAAAAGHHITSQVRTVERDAVANGITLEQAIDRYLANPPTFRDSGARAARAS